MDHRSTRRTAVKIAALVGAGTALPVAGVSSASAMRAQDGTIVGEATVPAWIFSVLELQDPYSGELLEPKDPEPGLRYLGAEVTIRNDSNAPLELATSAIRLIDYEGTEYSNSGVQGTEPRLRGFNMMPGEQARGWIWFGVPESSELAELVYNAPEPRLRVSLIQDGSAPPEGTPTGG